MLMNNVAQQAGTISKLSDAQLSQELSNPTGIAPSYLVMSEIQKRQALRSGGSGAGSAGPAPTIKQQMMAKAPAPTMPEVAGSMDGANAPPIPGPQDVPIGQGAGPGGILGLAQMSRVPGMAIRKPVGYDQAQPSAYAFGGPVRGYAEAGPVLGGGDVAAVDVNGQPLPPSGDLASATPTIPIGRLPVAPGSYDFNKALSAPGYYGMSALDYLSGAQGMVGNVLANSGVKAPQSMQDNYQAVYNDVLGGDKTFTSPYDPAIQAYKAQMSQGPSPVAQALMKAGAAMMSAPNGSLLAGLGTGLNSGVDAYSQAQNAQRAVQDKMLQAQIAQGNALVGGKEHALGAAATQQQMQGSMYNSAMQNATTLANQAMQMPFKAKDAQDASDRFDAGQAQQISLEGMRQSGDNSRQVQNLTFQLPVQAKMAYDQVYSSTIRAKEMAARQSKPGMMIPDPATGQLPTLPPETQAQIQQAAQKEAQQAARRYTTAGMQALKLPTVVKDNQGNSIQSPYLTAWQQ